MVVQWRYNGVTIVLQFYYAKYTYRHTHTHTTHTEAFNVPEAIRTITL
jgi:hypothetical protein